MRIVYLTQWFEPEPNIVKGCAFVRAIEAAGHEVEVVTGFPNYPTGKVYDGYRQGWAKQESVDGVRVTRLPLYPSHDRSSLRRSLNFLSFFLSAFLFLLTRRRSADLVYAYHPPITVGLAAALAGWVRRVPFILDVQDLWPDTIAATGMTGASRLERPLGALCGFVYRRSAAIVVQSEGMRRTLIARGVPAGKVETIRNWADGDALRATGSDGENARFTLVYGGNLGRAQALGTLIDAAALVERRRSDIEIVLHGDGVETEALKRHAAEAGLHSLHFRERVDQGEIVAIFARASALLIHLADDPLFAITIPSKTQFCLAMGRPIVAGLAGEAAELLDRSGAALVVPPQNPQALADAICRLADLSPAERAAMGAKGRDHYARHFAFDRAMARTLAVVAGTHA